MTEERTGIVWVLQYWAAIGQFGESGMVEGEVAAKTNLSPFPFCLGTALVKVINLMPQDESPQRGTIYTSDPYSCSCSKSTDLSF